MSAESSARQRNALRKIRKSRHLSPEIKEAVQVVIDMLNHKTDHNVAWPSANTIATRLGRKRRSGLLYVKVIKALGIFRWLSLTPRDAVAFCEQHYGYHPKLDRCGGQAPNLFIVNTSHPLWNSKRELPEEIDREMGELARRVKVKRNVKTTSRLASDPSNHPKRRRYSLRIVRHRISQTLERLKKDVANEDVLRHEEAERWCRDELLNGVANDTIDDVATDTQVFRRSSCEADEVVIPQKVRHQKAESEPLVIPSPKGAAVRQPCSQALRADTPPTRQFLRRMTRQTQEDEVIALAGSECRFASASLVENGFAVPTKTSSTVPVGHKMSEQGIGRIDGELLGTMERLEAEQISKEQRLATIYGNRPGAVVLDSVSLAVRCPSFSTGRTQGCP